MFMPRRAFHIPFAFVALLVLAVGAGCPEDTPSDAGQEPEPTATPETDAGEEGLGVGEACRTDANAGECQDGLLCLPSQQNPNVGSCRRVCGSLDNDVVFKDDGVDCGEGQSCQTVAGPDARPDFVVCLPVTTERDGECFSADDPAGCDGAGIAAALGVGADQVSCDYAGGLAPPFRCKVRCVVGDDDSCPDEERCFVSENPLLDLELPADGEGDRISCTPSVCGAGEAGCECSADYPCRLLASGETLCAREVGNCGQPVEPLTERQLSFENRCNGVDDSLFCDTSSYDALDNGADVRCVTAFLGFPSDNDGQCLGICSRPTFDYDRNGVVDDDEQAQVLSCREGEVCRTDTFGLRNLGSQTCDPEECPEGAPCDACSGDGECVESSAGPRCGVYLGTCTDEERVDGGGPIDAGPVGVDAGEPDAGVADGGTLDAGSPVDAGAPDAGPPVDAGAAPDAGLAIDSGVSVDAGTPADAGASDAGTAADAGS